MPDIYPEEKQEAPAINTPEETELIHKLWEYTDPKYMPWQADYHKTLVECYQFKELKQWEGEDMKLLALADTPQLPVDRIGRNLDAINGVRSNTGNAKRVVKRELGDDRVAGILNDVKEYVEYTGNFSSVRDDAFNALLDCGMGIRKLGFDPYAMGGEGEIWAEFCNTEDCGWSKCESKEFENVRWIYQKTVVDWADAILYAPEKAAQINSLKTLLATEYENLKTGAGTGTLLGKDYGLNNVGSEGAYSYPDQVMLIELWKQRRVPYKKVASIRVADDNGIPLPMPIPQISKQPSDYQVGDGEQELGYGVDRFYDQYVMASGGSEQSTILLKTGRDDDHPFVGMCAERKKSGAPMGFVERVVAHQKRKNIAWAQKIAYNNKSIKSPLVIQGGNPNEDILAQQSSFGAILRLKPGENIVSINQQPNVNLQAIEEGEAADRDMDFAAAASEPVLRGAAGSSSSGVQLVRQQDAAITPLNKWVKADGESELIFGRKLLRLIIKHFKPERMARIVGPAKFLTSLGYVVGPMGQPAPNPMAGKVDPMTNETIPMPVPLPLTFDVEHYDVKIEDKALNDFNKAQTFNAVEALATGGVFFTDEYRIRNAPIRDIDGAIESNRKARTDVIKQLMMQVEMLQGELQATQKLIPKESKQSPAAQGQKGRSAPQAGRRSMMGGQNGALGIGG